MKCYDIVSNNKDILVYLSQADKNFAALGYTEQGIRHAKVTSSLVEKILSRLKFSEKEVDLAKTAAFVHDIGCAVAYKDHDQNGSMIVYNILSKLDIEKKDLFTILSLISAHEDLQTVVLSELASAITIADKSDVLRERVKKSDFKLFDKHDTVHYAVIKNDIDILPQRNTLVLELTIDTSICSVLDYFEIFMSRVNFCKVAANKLRLNFDFYINKVKYL